MKIVYYLCFPFLNGFPGFVSIKVQMFLKACYYYCWFSQLGPAAVVSSPICLILAFRSAIFDKCSPQKRGVGAPVDPQA